MQGIITGMLMGLAGVAGHIAGFDWELLLIWCFLMAIDIVTGYMHAVKTKKCSSRIMRKGIYAKLLDTMAILAVLLMQSALIYLGLYMGFAPIGAILIGAFCFKEVTSILENTLGEEGFPKVLRQWLDRVRNALNDQPKTESKEEK